MTLQPDTGCGHSEVRVGAGVEAADGQRPSDEPSPAKGRASAAVCIYFTVKLKGFTPAVGQLWSIETSLRKAQRTSPQVSSEQSNYVQGYPGSRPANKPRERTCR